MSPFWPEKGHKHLECQEHHSETSRGTTVVELREQVDEGAGGECIDSDGKSEMKGKPAEEMI